MKGHMKSKSFLIFLTSVFLMGCGARFSKEKEQHSETKPDPDPTTNLPDELKHPPAVEINFDQVAVIREFGGIDTGALFGFRPTSGTVEITGIEGPSFLNGFKTAAGVIGPESAGQLFSLGENPMPPIELDALIEKYKGYSFIYFEKYDGHLCAGEDMYQSVSISTKTSGGKSYNLGYRFDAVPQPKGDCKFHTVGYSVRNF